jgi:hypothetical protein
MCSSNYVACFAIMVYLDSDAAPRREHRFASLIQKCPSLTPQSADASSQYTQAQATQPFVEHA